MRRQRTPLRQRRRESSDQQRIDAATLNVWDDGPDRRWMSIDPSSSRTGVAIWPGLGGQPTVEALTGATGDGAAGYLDRIDQMANDVLRIMVVHCIRGVVIEIPSGRPGAGARGGATGHLAIYGMAVGAIWWACRMMFHGSDAVVAVDERTWTRGRPQRARIALAGMVAPQLASLSDPGGDIADAVALGHWWQSQVPMLRALSQAAAAVNTQTNSHEAGAARRRKKVAT